MSKSLSNRIIWAAGRRYHRHKVLKDMHALDAVIDKYLLKNHVSPISDAEFADVLSFWKPYLPGPVGKQYYSLLKYVYPNLGTEYPLHEYLSESIVFSNLIRRLNPKSYYKALSEKTMYGVIFKDVNRPYEFLKVSNDVWVDGYNKAITKQMAVDRIMEEGEPVVFKKSRDTQGGLGVSVLREYDKEQLQSCMDQFNNNFVVQKWVKQSRGLSELNESSLNTFRVTTLLLNNRVSVLSHDFRVGARGRDVDNISNGGVMFGVGADGVVLEGIQGQSFHMKNTPNGEMLTGRKLDHLDTICDFAKDLHMRIPLCAMVGWDIGLDINDQPVLIEVNLAYPDVKTLQLLSGVPVFRDRFTEVIDYLF